MNGAKLEVLRDLLKQMQGLMAEGEGDEEMKPGDISEAIEEAGDGEGPESDSGMSITEACAEDDDPLAEEKKNFMRGMSERPKKPALHLMAKKKPAVSVSIEKTVAVPKKKAGKGKY